MIYCSLFSNFRLQLYSKLEKPTAQPKLLQTDNENGVECARELKQVYCFNLLQRLRLVLNYRRLFNTLSERFCRAVN